MIDEKGKKCRWRFKMSGNGKPLSSFHLFTLFFLLLLFSFHLDTSPPPPPDHQDVPNHTDLLSLSALCIVEKKEVHTWITTTTKPKNDHDEIERE